MLPDLVTLQTLTLQTASALDIACCTCSRLQLKRCANTISDILQAESYQAFCLSVVMTAINCFHLVASSSHLWNVCAGAQP